MLEMLRKNIIPSGAGSEQQGGRVDFGWAGIFYKLSMELGQSVEYYEELRIGSFLHRFAWLTWLDARK